MTRFQKLDSGHLWGWGVCIIQLPHKSSAHTAWATDKNRRRDKTWLFSPCPFPPPSRSFPPLLWKQNLATHHIPNLQRTVWLQNSPWRWPGRPAFPTTHYQRLPSFLCAKCSFQQLPLSISLHKNHLWAHILMPNLLLLCCGWRLASPGTQWTGSRWFEKLCWPKRAGSNGGANGLGETPALADDPLSKGSPEPLLLLLV